MVGNDVGSVAKGGVASSEFVQRMQGYGLTTAEILYRRPDRKWLLVTSGKLSAARQRQVELWQQQVVSLEVIPL